MVACSLHDAAPSAACVVGHPWVGLLLVRAEGFTGLLHVLDDAARIMAMQQFMLRDVSKVLLASSPIAEAHRGFAEWFRRVICQNALLAGLLGRDRLGEQLVLGLQPVTREWKSICVGVHQMLAVLRHAAQIISRVVEPNDKKICVFDKPVALRLQLAQLNLGHLNRS